MTRAWMPAGVFVIGSLVSACGSSGGTSEAPASPPAASQPQPTPATAAIDTAKALNVGTIFPQGPGRDLVLDTCGSCHPVACSARGQRNSDQWDRIKESHKDKLTAMSADDYNTLFTYLKANFNDSKPEPQIPAEFIQQGCTPF